MALEFWSPKGPHRSIFIRVGAYKKDIRKEYEKQLRKWILIGSLALSIFLFSK
jgi:hypothetical protein